MSGHFDGIFSSKEAPEERRARRDRLMASATAVARGMRPESGQTVIDATEIALYGRLQVDVDGNKEDK